MSANSWVNVPPSDAVRTSRIYELMLEIERSVIDDDDNVASTTTGTKATVKPFST